MLGVTLQMQRFAIATRPISTSKATAYWQFAVILARKLAPFRS